MLEHVPYYLRTKYREEIKQGITNSCNLPSNSLSIDWQGNCFVCVCDGWLPVTVGHITNFENLESVWQSPVARSLQQDIEDKKFTHCRVDFCDIKKQNILKDFYTLSINIDESCNLQCPSCRSQKINHTSGIIFKQKTKWAEHIIKLINKFDHRIEIDMSGNGDPFASLICRSIITGAEPNPNHRYKISTNGLLLEKIIPQVKIVDLIDVYNISIDAGDKKTYEIVRRGGKWEVLIQNLDFLKSLDTKSKINLNFCLQKDNVHSLENFVRLVEQYGWIGIIHPVENWFTWNNFDDKNVLSDTHPLYKETVSTLKLVSQSKNIQLQGYIQDLI